MPFLKKRELPLPPSDNGFPNWKNFNENVEAVRQEISLKNSMNERILSNAQTQELPELPEESGMPELPELPNPKSKTFEIPEAPEEIARPMARPIHPVKGRAEEPRPLFIKVERFKEILDSVEAIDRKLREIKNAMQKLREIQAREAETMGLWESEVQELKEKLDIIEKTLSRVEK